MDEGQPHKAPDIEQREQVYTRAYTKSQSKITGFFEKSANSEKEDTIEGVEEDSSEEIDTSNGESEVMPESPEIAKTSTNERESRKRKQKTKNKHKKKK